MVSHPDIREERSPNCNNKAADNRGDDRDGDDSVQDSRPEKNTGTPAMQMRALMMALRSHQAMASRVMY